ncbi:motility associated factor glycosyltransferase family protein [Agarivorans gilvus]|uniref:DUF115 domain-containing protein n=1 Tax=Agarivorans gilvus TaxID=680279 RepID=A0ABQ1I3W3_9ALTE|nr:6-hydroxymethylpterin diphosphokinase MptE-like protein [Agarivorans gilvus]GGB10555.1 hypothetical protein GCM10007414_24910 [Agarivorans gilvus]
MLFNVSYQVHPDEETQQQLEASMGAFTKRRFYQNFKAFSQLFPELANSVGKCQLKTYAPFVTKAKYLNVSNNLKGRALYKLNPYQQVDKQLQSFSKFSLISKRTPNKASEPPSTVKPGSSLKSYFPDLGINYQPLGEASDNLIILGSGLGLHLDKLLASKSWNKVLLVEPSLELLHISLYTANWMSVLRYVSQQQCEFSLVAGVDGKNNFKHIDEWVDHCSLNDSYLVRHYHYNEFNQLDLALAAGDVALGNFNSFQPIDLSRDREFECNNPLMDCWVDAVPSQSVEDTHQVTLAHSRFKRNFDTLRKHFPDVAHAFDGYDLTFWQLFTMPNGELNLFHRINGDMLFSESPMQESRQYYQHYLKSPRIENLDARYILRKPSPFLHYKYSDELRRLVQKLPSERRQLPEKIPSFIMYGCSLGHHIETLLLEHKVDHFTLYEPSWDFFYASLFVINWEKIINIAEQEERHLYLSIGDDGSNLFNDIHNLLKHRGINILPYTFFFTSYFNENLDKSIRTTREKLQILTNIIEYFDHSIFNLAHTSHLLKQDNCYVMLKDKPALIKDELKNTPVFIVGNGPSLDHSIDVIKENIDKAVIVSCGTSLKALYELGIKPDFHAEVEQTNATTLWISQVPDKHWLKDISLVSVCGVHPNVAALFKDCYLGMKLGEASTVAYGRMNSVFDEFQGILYSYPTVSNCAISSLIKLGFKNLYLFGVDLGFKDVSRHHSQHSAYYKKDGEALYDYNRHGIGFRVKGNFGDDVFTKHEFKFSAEVISESLAEAPDVDCYNTSDGAFIENTHPLTLDSVLLLNPVVDKNKFKARLKNEAYKSVSKDIIDSFDSFYSQDAFNYHFDKVRSLWEQPCESWEQALEKMDRQDKLFKESAQDLHSLFYFLLRGSGSFCLTYMTRLAFSAEDESLCMERLADAIDVWKNYLDDAKAFYLEHYGEFDKTNAPLEGAEFG